MKMSRTMGLIHPGAMGASVGAAAAGCGSRVLWASQGRSEATRQRAARAGLEDCGTIEAMVKVTDSILSVCPPHAAEAVAEDVSRLGFKGLYVDGNAVSPHRTRKIAEIVARGGADFVDGGIIGGPAWRQESGTRFYLSGPGAEGIAAYFAGSPLVATVISDRIGAASALKMCFAANTKGTTALLTAILAVAEREGVRADLEQQWGGTFTEQTHRRVADNTAKAWRFAGEMREIAETFAAAGMPGGFHQGAAEIFERLSDFKDGAETPPIEIVLERLLQDRD